MTGQMSIFDFLNEPKPGDWLDEGEWSLGEPIDFNDLQEGMLVWANKSTERHEWWRCLRVDHAYRDSHGEVSRWIMESGKRDPEYHSAVYMSTLAHKPMHGEVWYRRVL